jgi:hypothetical protein
MKNEKSTLGVAPTHFTLCHQHVVLRASDLVRVAESGRDIPPQGGSPCGSETRVVLWRRGASGLRLCWAKVKELTVRPLASCPPLLLTCLWSLFVRRSDHLQGSSWPYSP